VFHSRGGVELPVDGVLVEGGVEDGVVLDGMLLDGMLLGGRVLGVAVPVAGGHPPATVEEVLLVPVVPTDPGVALPMVPAGVPVEVEVVLPGAVEVPFVPQGPTVVAVVPLGTVDWPGVVGLEVPGVVGVDWLGVVVVDWLGVVVVDCEGVTPVELGIPGVVEGLVCVADGLPMVPAPPGVVAVVPGCAPVVPVLPGAPAVPVPAPVVCAAATPIAKVNANEANKLFFMRIAPASGDNGRDFCCSEILCFLSGMRLEATGDGICWPQESVTVQ
jgi:hypothetical protein